MIAFHSAHEQVHGLARHLMGRIESDTDHLRGYYSALSASELLVRPIRTSVEHFTHMQAFLVGFPNLTILPIDLVVAGQAATLRAITRLHLADAFIIATGLVAGCEAIVTNDGRWTRQVAPLFNQFRWIFLDSCL
jgi:predicted nucleic acid-binding protein